jgi:dTDP-4-amino-4,6-dideoxygalactose transaminase
LLNAVNFLGAKPLLADVDPSSGNLTPQTVKKAIRKNTRAIIVPHLFGYPADVSGICRLGIPVIEDCAQCVGARIDGHPVGSLSNISIFSFYATKLITGGEGGMVTSFDRKIIKQIISFREYDNRAVYVPSFNFKMSDLRAAVARAQVKKLPLMIRKRHLLACRYRELLAPFHRIFKLPLQENGISPVYFRFVVRCASAGLRDRIIKKMDAIGISCRKPVFIPLHHYLGLKGFPGTDTIYRQALSLPLYPGLEIRDVDYIVGQIGKIL